VTSRELAARLAALPEVEMRRTVLCEHLERTPADEAVAMLDDMLRRGRQAEPPFDAALSALAAAADERDGTLSYRCRSALYATARALGMEAVAGYFLSAREGTAPPPQPERALLPRGRPLTLGERKALARRPGDLPTYLLDRLARDPEPDVIRALLANPRLTEQEVIVIAALRPQSPANLREVFRARRWSTRYRVRRALAQNPHTPGEIAVRALAFLNRQDLAEVAADAQLGESVRREAAALLRSRNRRPS
jgi:hypothetical protein